MRNNFDYYQKIEKPNMYLCNPDRTPIGFVNSENRHLVLRFNDLSELSFTAYNLEGIEDIYNRLETKRLLFIENIGWFQITNVSCSIEGNIESKEITAESHQTQLKSRGFISEDKVYMFYNPNDPADDGYDSDDISAIPSIVGQLYKQLGIKIEINIRDEEITRDYDEWTIVYIDQGLWYNPRTPDDNICRSFKAEKTFGYDFIINNVSKAFEVLFEFDFLHHAIKIKRFEDVTIATDIYLSLGNVVESINVTEKSENIVTVLSCAGKNLDINMVNPMGTSYLVNFDYYKKLISDDGKMQYPWMSQSLIEALDQWECKWNSWQEHDDNRVGHEESFAELVEELQLLYKESEEISTRVKTANVQFMDLGNARDAVIRGDSNTSCGDGLIITEVVKLGEKSLETSSEFYSNPFSDSAIISGFRWQPTARIPSYSICESGKVGAKKVVANGSAPTIGEVTLSEAQAKGATTAEVGDYVYGDTYFEQGVQSENRGNVNSMISDLITDSTDSDGNWQPSDGNTPYLYFFDDGYLGEHPQIKSFCKLIIGADIGLVKDENGFISKNGTAEVHNVEFGVITTTEAGLTSFTISCPDGSSIVVTTTSPYFNYGGLRYKMHKYADSEISTSSGKVAIYCFYVSGFQRYTTYKTLGGDGGWCSMWESHVSSIQEELDAKQEEIDAVVSKMNYISDDCEVQRYIARQGDDLYREFFNYWIEGEYTNDNISATTDASTSEKIRLAEELMESGKAELEKVSQPTFELSVSSINFIKLIEFRKFTDQLALGCVITVEKNDDVHYRPALVAIEYDLDSPDNFSLTFSTAGKLDETAMTFADLLNASTATSRTVSANWSNITDYWNHRDEINSLLANPLDAARLAAKSNATNQEFTINDTGILGRKKTDDSGTAFAPEQVRMMNNTIIFTDDNWQTIRTALGSIYYEENGHQRQAYGLVAEVLVGSLLLGEKLEIRNAANTISLDDGGITIKSNSEVDQYTNEPITVFRADPSGDVYVRGSIVATHLTLGSLVTIPESSIEGLAAVAATGSYGDLTGRPDLSVYVQITGGHIQSSDYQYTSGNYSTAGMKIDLANKYIRTTNLEIDSSGNLHTKGGVMQSSDYSYSSGNYSSSGMRVDLTNKYIRTPNFYIDSSGNLYAKNATLEGEIISETGEIGGFTLGSNQLFNGKSQYSDSANDGVYIGTDGIALGKDGFSVDSYGNVSIKRGGIEVDDLVAEGVDRTLTYKTKLKNHKLTFVEGGRLNSSTHRYNDWECDLSVGKQSSMLYTNTIYIQGTPVVITSQVDNQGLFCDYYDWSSSVGDVDASLFVGVSGVLNSPDPEMVQKTYNAYGIVRGCPTLTLTAESTGRKYRGSAYIFIDGENNEGKLYGTWKASDNAAITSDRALKHDIEDISDIYDSMFDKIKPVRYKYNHGTSNRYHTGFIAQDIKEAIVKSGLSTNDFAAYVESKTEEGSIECSIRYSEIIALNTDQIQKLKARVFALENEIKELKGE